MAQSYAMVLAYEGGPFCGWQIQPHGHSVQGALETALGTITRAPVKVTGSGRTDAGVHAFNQVAHFRLETPRPPEKLRASLNGICAPDLSVRAIVPVPEDFHARHRARGKIYRYLIHNRAYPPLPARGHAWWVKLPLDHAAMAAAARHLLGRHDFSAFRGRHCEAAHPTREIRRLEVWAQPNAPHAAPGTLCIEVEADAFLQHMARIITGTLVAVGKGLIAPEEMAGILASRDRARAASTAPPEGLHLMRVHYDLKQYPTLAALLPEDAAE